MGTGVRTIEGTSALRTRTLEIRVRNGSYWFLFAVLFLGSTAMAVIVPDEAEFFVFFGGGMALMCVVLWLQERRKWQQLTIAVEARELRCQPAGSPNSRAIAIDPKLNVRIERRALRTTTNTKPTVRVRYDLWYGSNRLVRNIESKRGAESIRQHLNAALDFVRGHQS